MADLWGCSFLAWIGVHRPCTEQTAQERKELYQLEQCCWVLVCAHVDVLPCMHMQIYFSARGQHIHSFLAQTHYTYIAQGMDEDLATWSLTCRAIGQFGAFILWEHYVSFKNKNADVSWGWWPWNQCEVSISDLSEFKIVLHHKVRDKSTKIPWCCIPVSSIRRKIIIVDLPCASYLSCCTCSGTLKVSSSYFGVCLVHIIFLWIVFLCSVAGELCFSLLYRDCVSFLKYVENLGCFHNGFHVGNGRFQ